MQSEMHMLLFFVRFVRGHLNYRMEVGGLFFCNHYTDNDMAPYAIVLNILILTVKCRLM